MTVMTIAEILDQPALVPLWPTVGQTLHLAESTTYQLAAQNRLPFKTVRLGRRLMVRTVDLHRFLGLAPEETGDGPVYQTGSPAGDDEEGGYQPPSPVEHSSPTHR